MLGEVGYGAVWYEVLRRGIVMKKKKKILAMTFNMDKEL